MRWGALTMWLEATFQPLWVHRIKFWVQPLENNPLSLFTSIIFPPLVSRRKEMSKISFHTLSMKAVWGLYNCTDKNIHCRTAQILKSKGQSYTGHNKARVRYIIELIWDLTAWNKEIPSNNISVQFHHTFGTVVLREGEKNSHQWRNAHLGRPIPLDSQVEW